MKARRKLSILMMSVIVSIFVLTGFFSGSARAQKAIEWKMLAPWGLTNVQIRTLFVTFVEEVNKRAAGRLKISWFGAESVPAFEQLKPVRDGVFDGNFTSFGYHTDMVAVGNGQSIFMATERERRAAGTNKILDEAYRKKANVTYFSGFPDGCGYTLILKKKIDKADLTGLKIRSSSFYDPLIKALHGIPVRISGGEAYSALERGVTDGTGFTAAGSLDVKFYEVTKCHVKPYYGEACYPMLLNLNSWNKLPKDLQDLLTSIALEVGEKGRDILRGELEREEKELQKRGIEFVTLSPKEAEKYLSAFYENTWEELVLKLDPEFGPRLKEAAKGLMKK